MVLRLIYSKASPAARKIRIALAEKGIPVDLRDEFPWDSETRTQQYNPLQNTPVLLKENGTSVYGSPLILEWIEVNYPPPEHPPIYPQVKEREILAKQVEVLADGICDAAVLLFYERQREHPSPAWTEHQSRKVESGLKNLSMWVRDREFIMINKLTVADISVGSMLAYLRLRFAEDWKRWAEHYPTLLQYSEHMEERPSFKSTVLEPSTIRDKIV